MLYGAIFVVFVLMIRLDARSSTVNPVTSLNFKVQKVHKGTIFLWRNFSWTALKKLFYLYFSMWSTFEWFEELLVQWKGCMHVKGSSWKHRYLYFKRLLHTQTDNMWKKNQVITEFKLIHSFTQVFQEFVWLNEGHFLVYRYTVSLPLSYKLWLRVSF